jgi:hypothetical protein
MVDTLSPDINILGDTAPILLNTLNASYKPINCPNIPKTKEKLPKYKIKSRLLVTLGLRARSATNSSSPSLTAKNKITRAKMLNGKVKYKPPVHKKLKKVVIMGCIM